MNYGLQLYSVRDSAQHDLRGALRQVARLGYENVEFAGYFNHAAATVKSWLREYKLRVSGAHVGLRALDEDFDGTVAYHLELGCKLLIIPFANPQNREETQALIAKLNGYQRRLAAEGITLGYHNHAHEFKTAESGISLWDALVAQTSLPLELDTFWAYAAGQDAAQWMKALNAQRRLPAIHIKDGLAGGEGKPLGMGTAPVRQIYQTALELNVPMVVESETLTPTGMEEARVCIAYLHKEETP
jgi:sugar phosphate isomerase/epimerase